MYLPFGLQKVGLNYTGHRLYWCVYGSTKQVLFSPILPYNFRIKFSILNHCVSAARQPVSWHRLRGCGAKNSNAIIRKC